MRIFAAIFLADAIGVWWFPADRLGQSAILIIAAGLSLALRSAWKRTPTRTGTGGKSS